MAKGWSANFLLNKLMKAGYMNDLVRVDFHEREVQEELAKAPFKCKTEKKPSNKIKDKEICEHTYKVDCGPDCLSEDDV